MVRQKISFLIDIGFTSLLWKGKIWKTKREREREREGRKEAKERKTSPLLPLFECHRLFHRILWCTIRFYACVSVCVFVYVYVTFCSYRRVCETFRRGMMDDGLTKVRFDERQTHRMKEREMRKYNSLMASSFTFSLLASTVIRRTKNNWSNKQRWVACFYYDVEKRHVTCAIDGLIVTKKKDEIIVLHWKRKWKGKLSCMEHLFSSIH